MAYDETTPEDLLSLIEALFGIGPAMRFSHRFGGTSLYIPRSIADDNLGIVKALGRERALRLVAEVGGDQFYVSRRLHRRWRTASVLRLKARGVKVARIAQRLGLGNRQVYNICRRARLNGTMPK